MSFYRICFLIIFLFFASCSGGRKNFYEGEFKLLQIDNKSLQSNIVLQFEDIRKRTTIILLIKKPGIDVNSSKSWRIGDTYFLNLKRLFFLKEKGDEAGIRFNHNDIYIEGDLIFPSKYEVYELINN